jgi:hypothetical protein
VALATFKRNIYSIEKTFIGKFSSTIPIIFTHKIWGLTIDRFCRSGVIDTTVAKIGDFIVDFLCAFEAIFKKAGFNTGIRGLGGVVC